MPGTGNDESLGRDMLASMIARKTGAAPIKLVTRGDVEFEALLHHQMNSLPEVHMDPVQNDDGSWPYMAGWDGPQPDDS